MDEEKMMKKTGTIIVLMLVVVSVLLGGCLADPMSTDTEQTNADISFLNWVISDMDYHKTKFDTLSTLMTSDSWYSLETISEQAEDHTTSISKPKCNSYAVSTKFRPLQIEYYAYLSDISWVYFYTKWAGKEMQDGLYAAATESLNDAMDYIDKALAHNDRIDDIIASLN